MISNVTTFDDRTAWLAARKHSLGASDVAGVMRIPGAFSTPYEVWADKRGLKPPNPMSERMEWGHRLEQSIGQAFADHTGIRLFDAGEYAVAKHPDVPYLTCTLDRWFEHAGLTWVLEVKTADPSQRDKWPSGKERGLERFVGPEDIPFQYWCQVQVQLSVTGADMGVIAVLVGLNDFRYFAIARDEKFIAHMLECCAEFWARVDGGDPPPAEGGDSEMRAIKLANGMAEKPTMKRLPDELTEFDDTYVLAEQETRKWNGAKEKARNRILQAMGDAHTAVMTNGSIWKRTKSGGLRRSSGVKK